MAKRRSQPAVAVRVPGSGPPLSCNVCPRLTDFRRKNSRENPGWHNAPVPSFGRLDAELLIIGLAPGLKGANRTGRPFTGDFAGDLLYRTLARFGFAAGTYGADAGDGFVLKNARVTNAVRCVPPENKPTGAEAAACRPFLIAEMGVMHRLKAILALGAIAHDAVLAAEDMRKAAARFKHGARHLLPSGRLLLDSYHCSRYNTNTGVLTEAMFAAVVSAIREVLETDG
ncbi:MAG: uracil-DNA glycosylase [Alphaproteobacteria bacterium]|nr:uracil-DNA glycosylase [Alphaproteobacteria bacterium]